MARDRDYRLPDENMDIDIDEIIGKYDALDEDPTLESILAEYKGEAYIDGDKRTPSEVLKKRADAIVEEVTGALPKLETEKRPPVRPERPAQQQTERPAVRKPAQQERPVSAKESPAPRQEPRKQEKNGDDIDKWFDEYVSGGRGAKPAVRQEGPEQKTPSESAVKPVMDDTVVANADSWESLDFSNPITVDKFAKELSKAMENETIVDEPLDEEFDAGRRRRYKRIIAEDDIPEEESIPDTAEEAARFAAPLKSLTLRLLGAGVICLVMTVFTYLFFAGKNIPFGIKTDQVVFTAVLLIMQCIVMILGMDIFISGFSDLIHAEPGAESLLLISCVMTLIDGFIMFVRGTTTLGLPFSLVSAWAVFFAVWGRKAYYTAMRDSLRMSLAGAAPYGVISEENVEDRKILKKVAGQTDGFYIKLTQADFSETTYALAVPLLMLVSFIFAFLASVGRGSGENFAHCFAVMLAVSASFPALMAFALPFKYVAKRVKHSGGAIAGWGGACDVYDSDSAIITDEDLFPLGTVSLSGVKLFGNTSQRKAIIYTSSLVIASKSGLTKVFAALLKEQSLNAVNIENFACYEGGGIGALIDGERVLVGSGGFMNLMGIRVPESINLNNSVFTAVNDELAAVFSINYIPANSVQNALVSVLNTRVDILLAVRDFNVTPNMIQHKFKVSMEGVKIIPAETSYKVSEETVAEGTMTSAILCREGLGPFAETIASGRLLKKMTDINTIVSLAGAAIGLLLMFFLCWSGAYESASVKNVFVFMIVIEACVVLLSKIVNQRL